MKHVQLNGVWYDLAESAEGEHYSYGEEPLRPPNAQMVQGDDPDFQLRPDLLLWRITNWSAGEGQIKFDAQQPDRSYILQNVDPFSRPGLLTIGYRAGTVQLSGGDLNAANTSLGAALGVIYCITHTGTPAAYSISNGTATTKTAPPANARRYSICGDEDALFAVLTSGPLYKYDGATTWTLWNDQFTDVGTFDMAVDLENYVYVMPQYAGEIYELSKVTANTTTTETPLYEFSPGDADVGPAKMCVGDGRIYFYTNTGFKSVIHEVVPSSAAGTGYGRVVTTIQGIKIEAMWFDGGTLYFHARDGATGTLGTERNIYYLDPDGSYGALGSVRTLQGPWGAGPPVVSGTTGIGGPATSGRSTRTAFLLPATAEDTTAAAVAQSLWEIEGISGGYAAVGLYPTSVAAQPTIESGLLYDNGKYYCVSDDDNVVYLWDTSLADNDNDGYAISPVHDFNISEEKILERIEVRTEQLPSGAGAIDIAYSTDGGETWTTSASIVSGTNDDFGEWQISTDASTVTFRDLKIKVTLNSGTAKAYVTSIDVFARVVKKVKVWDLMLDCTDSASLPGYNGAKIIDNIKSISENTVVKFIDRYQSHNQQEAGDEYDVTIDAARLILSQQGEGIFFVRLIEAR